MIKAAISHRGFSYLHILSPCVTFDKTELTYKNMDVRVRDLPEEHHPASRMEVMRLAAKSGRPALGLYFKEERPALSEEMDDIAARAAG